MESRLSMPVLCSFSEPLLQGGVPGDFEGTAVVSENRTTWLAVKCPLNSIL